MLQENLPNQRAPKLLLHGSESAGALDHNNERTSTIGTALRKVMGPSLPSLCDQSRKNARGDAAVQQAETTGQKYQARIKRRSSRNKTPWNRAMDRTRAWGTTRT